MHVSVKDAKAQFSELLDRAESGEEIVFTRDGRETARLVPGKQHAADPVKYPVTPAERLAFLQSFIASARTKPIDGPSAARSQDFLYDENGLPG